MLKWILQMTILKINLLFDMFFNIILIIKVVHNLSINFHFFEDHINYLY